VSELLGTPYYQYSGTGNTFILLDNRTGVVQDGASAAKEICPQFSVDGLLLIEKSSQADIRMRIVNSDGSEVSMCGNGSRCAAHWAHHEAGFADHFRIETGAGVLKARLSGDTANVRLTDPKDLKKITSLEVAGSSGEIYSINTGVPHVVVEARDIDALDVEALGAMIRRHHLFQPEGTNATIDPSNGFMTLTLPFPSTQPFLPNGLPCSATLLF